MQQLPKTSLLTFGQDSSSCCLDEFKLSKYINKSCAGIFFVGYAVFAIPSTFVCASVGAPAFLGTIMVVWGLTAALFSAMQNSWQFFLLRFLLGLAESGAYPGEHCSEVNLCFCRCYSILCAPETIFFLLILRIVHP